MVSAIVGITKFIFYSAVFLTPVLGVWLISSLVAYTNGPVWISIASGILFFPLLPILWDCWSYRSSRRAILTWGDRITLRTLVLNLTFISLLLALKPETAFLALSTRGDWMLDGQQGQPIEWVRRSLFTTAEGLEWLHSVARQNPYRRTEQSVPVLVNPTPTPSASQAATGWPWTGSGLHPAVATMPPQVETSITSVAQYIAEQESDPFLRVKALHDYVADRIAYDAVSYQAGLYPPQDAETVFRTHKAVCAGYSQLLEALGKAIGIQILYITGDSRTSNGDISGQGHAWNAVKINNDWYLIDATWDSGYVQGSQFIKEYKTSYLFPPPSVMILSHFPDDPSWQLLRQPIAMGEFLRQPMLRPTFFAEGLELISPTRSQSDVTENAVIQLNNPQQRWLTASYERKGHSESNRCYDAPSQSPTITCQLPGAGTYHIRLFSGDGPSGSYAYVGQLEFNRR
jgi:hypothetical protein